MVVMLLFIAPAARPMPLKRAKRACGANAIFLHHCHHRLNNCMSSRPIVFPANRQHDRMVREWCRRNTLTRLLQWSSLSGEILCVHSTDRRRGIVISFGSEVTLTHFALSWHHTESWLQWELDDDEH